MLRSPHTHRGALLAALMVTHLAAPTETRACYYASCDGAIAGAVTGGVVLGLGSLAVLGTDLSHNLRGRWVNAPLAYGNLALGAVNVAGGAALAASFGSEQAIGWGLGFATAGLFMLLEGTMSLLLYEDGDRPLGLSLGPGPGDAGISMRIAWY